MKIFIIWQVNFVLSTDFVDFGLRLIFLQSLTKLEIVDLDTRKKVKDDIYLTIYYYP